MASIRDVEKHLRKYPISELEGKLVPADLLVGYLFLEHDHHPGTEVAIVDSMALEEFIREYVGEI